jgi:hypothetical protein
LGTPKSLDKNRLFLHCQFYQKVRNLFMDIKSNTNQDQNDQKPIEQKQPIDSEPVNSEPIDQSVIPENTPETESTPETQISTETAVLTEAPPQAETPQLEQPQPEIPSEPETQPQPEPETKPQLEPEPKPQSQLQPEIPPQSAPEKYQDILDQYAASRTENIAPPIESPLPPKNPDNSLEEPQVSPEPQETVPNLASFNPNPEAPQNNIFKISFITSLIIFIFTSTVLTFVYLKSKSISTTSSIPSTPTTVVQTTPTIAPQAGTCILNEKTYQIGESFAATDGCNTCTCAAQNNISCTERECLATPTATKSAIKTTPTKTLTPTKTKTPVSTSSSSKI